MWCSATISRPSPAPGPINGPIQAAIFGWVPVLLWVLLGGIFFGAMHDFGALFASIRHKGQTLATVIAQNIDDTAKKLFCIFAYLTLILVVAAFASIVASTFAVVPVPLDDAAKAASTEAANMANMRTAMISVLFIVVAVIYGVATRGASCPRPPISFRPSPSLWSSWPSATTCRSSRWTTPPG